MIDQDGNRTVRLMHALGLQSGTVWEVCRLLGCVFDDVYHRGPERFEELLLKARSIGDAKRAAEEAVHVKAWIIGAGAAQTKVAARGVRITHVEEGAV